MSHANALASVERRVRRLAQRQGLSLLIAQKRNARIEAHGGYMLRADATLTVVFGNVGYEFSADLDEIEAYLLARATDD